MYDGFQAHCQGIVGTLLLKIYSGPFNVSRSRGDRCGVGVDFGVSLIVVSTSRSGALSILCIVSIVVFCRVFLWWI